MAEPDRTNADAERVSDIVARLPRWNPRLGGVFEPGDQPFVYMAKDGLGEWVRRSEAADIIEAQSKALAEAREVLRPAGNIAFNMKQTAIYTSDRDNYRRISEAIDTAIRALTPTPENPNG